MPASELRHPVIHYRPRVIARRDDTRPVDPECPLRWHRPKGPPFFARRSELDIDVRRPTSAESMTVRAVRMKIGPRPDVELLRLIMRVYHRPLRRRRRERSVHQPCHALILPTAKLH